MIQLRPFQQEIVAKVEQHDGPAAVVLATGGGKTVVASEIIRRAENKHVLYFAHRRELVHQPQTMLAEFGIEAGLILAGVPMNRMARVQLASVQTLWSRCVRGGTDLPPADIVFVDECHHVRARTYRQILERYPDAKVIGLTATPCRKDGRGLGSTFDTLIEGPQVRELIDLGYLVPTKVYAPCRPDLKGVKVRQGDYAENQLAERMDRAELVGDVVSHWLRHSDRKRTIIFATSVGHSRHIEDEMRRAGVRIAHVDGNTPKDERDDIVGQLAAGDIEAITNCAVFTEGFDLPDIGCIVLARPTKSSGLWRQMIGRGLRPAPGKDHCLVLDHAGAVFTHGQIEDEVTWTLAEDRKAENPAQEARASNPSSRLLECSQCEAIRTAGRPCDHCGFMPRRGAEYLHIHDGDLVLTERGKQQKPVYSGDQKREILAMLSHIARERGYKPGWTAHKYKEKFGHWPDRTDQINVVPISPSPEVLSWERSRRIAYAKAREKAAA